MANSEYESLPRSKSLELFRKKQVCVKVEDPNFGHRKTPENLKRIQRKLAMRSVQDKGTGHEENVQKLSNVCFQIRNDLTSATINHQRSSTACENQMEKQNPEIRRPWTTPAQQKTHNEYSKTNWMTKEEFIDKLFKSF